nr:hypothetical protein [Tanacetum cinerariifolium]
MGGARGRAYAIDSKIWHSVDPSENSSQSPLHINHHCCYECGDPLDGIFYRQCTCESCRNGAHIGYNCPPKVSIISNPKPCHNQNVDEFPQTLTSFHPTCYSGDENALAHDSTPIFVNDSPNVFNPPPQPPTYSYEFCGNNLIIVTIVHLKFRLSIIRNRVTIETLNFHKIFKISNNNILVVKAVWGRMKISIVNKQKILLLVWDRVSKIKNAFGNKRYKSKYVQELFCKLLNDVQNIHVELAEYINIPSWNRPAFSNYDDDEDYNIVITPEEPDNSLIMRDEHLDTIQATESDKVLKSSVENLIPVLSDSGGISDNMCDVPFCDNSLPLDVSKDQFEEFSDSNDDFNTIDDDYLSIANIDYVEASPLDFELVSLEEVKDDNLHEKLFNINLLIAKIESLNDNPTSDRVLKSPSLFPIPVEDTIIQKRRIVAVPLLMLITLFPRYDSFLFETELDQGKLTSVVMEDNLAKPRVHVPNVLTTHLTLMLDSNFIPFDNFLLESEIFYFDFEEKNSGSATIHANISLSDLECFNFKREPDPSELTSIVDFVIRENVLSVTNVNLPPEEDHSPLFAYVEWIFLSFLTYPVVPPYLLSSENKDTIFDPDISNYHFPSLFPGVSHRSETFMFTQNT